MVLEVSKVRVPFEAVMRLILLALFTLTVLEMVLSPTETRDIPRSVVGPRPRTSRSRVRVIPPELPSRMREPAPNDLLELPLMLIVLVLAPRPSWPVMITVPLLMLVVPV